MDLAVVDNGSLELSSLLLARLLMVRYSWFVTHRAHLAVVGNGALELTLQAAGVSRKRN